MTEVVEAIRFLRGRGVSLSVDGNTIRASYRCRTSELQEVKGAIAAIRAHKTEAIAVLHSLPMKPEADQFVTTCPLCGEPYTQRLHVVPESQPESFRKRVIEMRHTWFHRAGLLSLSSADREEYWRQAIEEAKEDTDWAHLMDPDYWQRKEKNKRR